MTIPTNVTAAAFSDTWAETFKMNVSLLNA